MTHEEAKKVKRGDKVTVCPAHDEAPSWEAVVCDVDASVGLMVQVFNETNPPRWVKSAYVHLIPERKMK